VLVLKKGFISCKPDGPNDEKGKGVKSDIHNLALNFIYKIAIIRPEKNNITINRGEQNRNSPKPSKSARP